MGRSWGDLGASAQSRIMHLALSKQKTYFRRNKHNLTRENWKIAFPPLAFQWSETKAPTRQKSLFMSKKKRKRSLRRGFGFSCRARTAFRLFSKTFRVLSFSGLVFPTWDSEQVSPVYNGGLKTLWLTSDSPQPATMTSRNEWTPIHLHNSVNPLPPSNAVRKRKNLFLRIFLVQYCKN